MGVNGLNGVVNAATFAAGLQKRKAELSVNGAGPKTAVASITEDAVFTKELVESWYGLLDEGRTVAQIAEDYSVGSKTILGLMAKHPRPAKARASALADEENSPKTAVANKPKNEQQKKNYKNIFTREVVEGWHKLVEEGWNVQRIGRENGLAVVDGNTIRAYLKKYPRPSVPDVTNPPAPTVVARADDAAMAVTAVTKPDAATVLARLAALVGELQALGCLVKVSVGMEVAYGNE